MIDFTAPMKYALQFPRIMQILIDIDFPSSRGRNVFAFGSLKFDRFKRIRRRETDFSCTADLLVRFFEFITDSVGLVIRSFDCYY